MVGGASCRRRKNIFQDIQLPQIIPLREELRSSFEKELSAKELDIILSKSIHLFELSVEINMSAVDGGCVPLETFEKYCKDIDNSLSQNDFYDLVYGISKLSEERHCCNCLVIISKVLNVELVKLFETYQFDEILYAHLINSRIGQELLQKIDGYIKEYGLMTVNGPMAV